MDATSLPMQSAPHDTLRYGLSSLKDEAAAAHPVQVLEQRYPRQQWDSKEKMLNSVYGSAFSARMQIERQILGRVQRPPGMQSSRLGLESLTGELDDFDFGSYLGTVEQSEAPPPDFHSVMEAKLGISSGPPSRQLP